MIERALVVAGLGFGDEGKGSVVDWLARQHTTATVIRYNGGSQAAHHVVTADGRTHCFSQFGAGTLIPGVMTFLSRFTIVDPLALVAEERALRRIGVTDGYARMSLDPQCVIVTPFHRLMNQMRELSRGHDRHGSCGLGIGEARLDSEQPLLPSVRVVDALDRKRLRDRLQLLWLSELDRAEQLVDAHPDKLALRERLCDLRRSDRVDGLTDAYHGFVRESGVAVTDAPTLDAPERTLIFEGAQGVLLDREHGFWPYVTPSDTTFAHAHTLIDELGGARRVERIGVLRAYATRHGAGPLPTEDEQLSAWRPDEHNGTHRWQGRFRLGWFDAPLARYAIRTIGGVDRLVVTNLDRLAGLPQVRLCAEYVTEAGVRATEIPIAAPGTRARRTRWLAGCRPFYIDTPGWCPSKSADALAPEAREFLNALQSPASINRSIDVLSMGPTAEHKQRLA